MKQSVSFVLFFLFCWHALDAQLSSTFQVHHYTTENGLPSNAVKGMQWDYESGFLWIGTEAGVVRFNGANFKVFNNQNTSIIKSERIFNSVKNRKREINILDNSFNVLTTRNNQLQ